VLPNRILEAHLRSLEHGHWFFCEERFKHKNLWLIDLETGARRQLTNLAPGFDIRDFDISPDGREVVLERVQERSDVVLLDLPDHSPASTQGAFGFGIVSGLASPIAR
jgi:hypothetical protein